MIVLFFFVDFTRRIIKTVGSVEVGYSFRFYWEVLYWSGSFSCYICFIKKFKAVIIFLEDCLSYEEYRFMNRMYLNYLFSPLQKFTGTHSGRWLKDLLLWIGFFSI